MQYFYRDFNILPLYVILKNEEKHTGIHTTTSK
jgi:hypothetical protein